MSWVNVAVFDFRSHLMRGEREIPMWPITDDLPMEEGCYPIGLSLHRSVFLNPVRFFPRFTNGRRKEGNVLFNDTLNTFYYGYMALLQMEQCCYPIVLSF